MAELTKHAGNPGSDAQRCTQPGAVAHACNSSTQRIEAELHKLKAILIYTWGLKTGWGM